VPSLRHFGTPIIAMVGRRDSTLGRHADIVLDTAVTRESCPNNLAPTASTTATLAMGDALAVALMEKRRFKPQDFALYHPGGSLGRRLLTRVKDVMHKQVPRVAEEAWVVEVIEVMTRGGLGFAVVHPDGEPGALSGVITDGDLRRALLAKKNIYEMHAREIMSSQPKRIADSEMFAVAEQQMLDMNITALVAVDDVGRVSGVLKLLDAKKL
jgi:arabinose-5-phosphate isomerase